MALRGQGGETRARLRMEALRLFAEHGVDAVSMRDIAAAADIKAASIYNHWASRSVLVADLFMDGYEMYGRRLAEVVAEHATFADRIGGIVRLICRLHDEDRNLFSFLLLTQHRNLSDVDRNGDTNPIAVLLRVVELGMSSGEIPPGDPDLVTAGIVGVVIQAATFSIYGRLPDQISGLADAMVVMALRVAGTGEVH